MRRKNDRRRPRQRRHAPRDDGERSRGLRGRRGDRRQRFVLARWRRRHGTDDRQRRDGDAGGQVLLDVHHQPAEELERVRVRLAKIRVGLGPHPVRVEALHQLEERVPVRVDRGVPVQPEDLVGRPALHRPQLLADTGRLMALRLEERVGRRRVDEQRHHLGEPGGGSPVAPVARDAGDLRQPSGVHQILDHVQAHRPEHPSFHVSDPVLGHGEGVRVGVLRRRVLAPPRRRSPWDGTAW